MPLVVGADFDQHPNALARTDAAAHGLLTRIEHDVEHGAADDTQIAELREKRDKVPSPITIYRALDFLRDNGLSLFFGAAFLLALLGQSISGLADYNQQQLSSGADPVSF